MAPSALVHRGSPGQGSQGRRTQRRGTSRRAGPVGEGGHSMPTALPLFSLVGSHWLGLLPMTEGRRPGDNLVKHWIKGGTSLTRVVHRQAMFRIHTDFLVSVHGITLSQPARLQSTPLASWRVPTHRGDPGSSVNHVTEATCHFPFL